MPFDPQRPYNDLPLNRCGSHVDGIDLKINMSKFYSRKEAAELSECMVQDFLKWGRQEKQSLGALPGSPEHHKKILNLPASFSSP